MYVEEICLAAIAEGSEADRPPERPETLAVLEQANRMRRCRSEFALLSNHQLSVRTQGVMQNSRDYTIDIGILDPQPKRLLKVCWSHLLPGAGLGGAAGFLSFTDLALQATQLPLILGVCAALILILGIYRSHDRLVFYSQYGRVPLVILFNRLPDQDTLNTFIAALARSIKDARAQAGDTNQTLSQELKAHRRLMEEGMISSRRYDIAKRRILGQHTAGSQ
jgi:hypothetical protein